MRNSWTFLTATTAIVLSSGIATAQDWDGFYGGATLGYAFGDATHSFSNAAPTGNSEPDGALVGAFVGYGIQSGNMVYGAELDIDYNSSSGSYVDLTGATSAGTVDGVWQGSIRGVLGYAGEIGGDPALFYATAGYAMGEFDFMGGPSATPTNAYTDTVGGWTVGVGVDWRFAQNTSMRMEYRYTDFDASEGFLSPAFPGVAMPVDMDQHVIRVGVRMEF